MPRPDHIAVAGYAFQGFSPEALLELIAGLGAAGLDYWPWNSGQLPAWEFRLLAEQAGVDVICVNVPGNTVRVAGPRPEEAIQPVTAAMREAVTLGARFVQVYAAVPPVGNAHQSAAYLADSLDPLLDRAEDFGLKLLVENNLDQRGEDPIGLNPSRRASTLADALTRSGRPSFGICFDPANFLAVGEEPYPHAYELLARHISTIHVKDCRGYQPSADRTRPEAARLFRDGIEGPFLPTFVGDGAVPWQEIFRRLASDDFPGWVVLDPFITDELLIPWCRHAMAAVSGLMANARNDDESAQPLPAAGGQASATDGGQTGPDSNGD